MIDLDRLRRQVMSNQEAAAAVREIKQMREALAFVIGEYPTNAVEMYSHWAEARQKARTAIGS